MNLKGIMQTLGARPGQVMSDPYARAWAPTPSPIKEAEGEDHEVSMAQNSLDTIIKMATELKAKMGENEKDIPAWIQDHITNSENFISQASSNYHEYSTNEAGINGASRFPSLDGVANESIREEVKDWDTIHNVFVKFLKANTKELEKRVLSKDEDATKKAIKSIVSGLTNAQRSLKMEAVEIPTIALPSTVKSKLTIAIDTIKDAELNYNQKVQVVKQVTDSLGIDKTEFNKIASRLKGTMESVNEGKFKVDDLVYNKKTKTVGIVRIGDDKYGEVKTDADGNVNVDELEKYNPIKHKHQQNAKVAPSTEKEVNNRGLFNPFKAESLRLKNLK